jgi:hypothetical protein
MSKLPNDCICLFYFQVGWWGGGVVSGWLYLINSLHTKKTQKTQTATQLYIFAKTCLPVMPSLLPHLPRQLKNNQNQTNTTGTQNLKEFNNTAGWLSVFSCFRKNVFFYFFLHLKCVFANILFISFIFNIKFMFCICFIIIIDLIFIEFEGI